MGLLIKTVSWDALNAPFSVLEELKMSLRLAIKHQWNIIQYEPSTYKIIFAKNGCKMGIYLSKMTVMTALHHPKQGKTQLTRKNVSPADLEKLFLNPRAHLSKVAYKVKPKK